MITEEAWGCYLLARGLGSPQCTDLPSGDFFEMEASVSFSD